jgi:hypothetical protein
MIKWLAKTKEIDLLGPFDTQVEAWEVLITSLGENDIPPDGSLVWPIVKKQTKAPLIETESEIIYPYQVKRN